MVIQASDLIIIFSVSLWVTERAPRIGAMEVIVKTVPGVTGAGV